ncbi:MAG: ABC transporter ATP-binding protein [Candidatus Bathyarchaeota archaeon]|nr:ABC transporter ATP-binding protein [Candidatus Bathyarchaeota archaeon]
MSVLDVKNLTTYYKTMRGHVKAVENVSFSLEKGEAMGLAGESGCGKTTVALSLLRILPSNGKILKGKMLFRNVDITKLSEEELRNKIRWKGISLIFQGAMNAMNPMYKIEDQIIEVIKQHEPKVTKQEARERIAKLFEMVGLEPERAKNYPHEFSGGMRQRAMIAMALACNPDIVIADEPGTALDVIVQAQVLKLMSELRDKLNLAIIMITHDLSIISETCERLAIMYAGKIVELGDVVTMFKKPAHPYTQGLISAFPNINAPRQKIVSIHGSPPDLLDPPVGCRFNPRCDYAMDICRKEEPKFKEVSKGHFVACHLVTR